MATQKLDDRVARHLPGPPRDGQRAHLVYYDNTTRGLGVRVTKNLHRAWILNYRVRGGQERRLTIGDCADWPVRLAREEARRLRRIIDTGGDPMQERREQRTAPTVADLCNRYLAEHAIKKRTKGDDEVLVRQWLLPELGNRKVADIKLADVEKFHRKISTRTPIRANRAVALLSKMMSLAIVHWQMRPEPNPCKGVQKNREESRERYLSPDELGRLTAALDAYPVEAAANAIRLLLLTGSRRGEVLGAKWSEFDMDRGVWVKPSNRTKQARTHSVPLSGATLQLLAEMRAAAASPTGEVFLFPARRGYQLKVHWAKICRAAGLADLRVHDLRHSFASFAINGGASLPIIGRLLGHSKVLTTARYAHLYDDTLRSAANAVGEVVTGAKPAPG